MLFAGYETSLSVSGRERTARFYAGLGKSGRRGESLKGLVFRCLHGFKGSVPYYGSCFPDLRPTHIAILGELIKSDIVVSCLGCFAGKPRRLRGTEHSP